LYLIAFRSNYLPGLAVELVVGGAVIIGSLVAGAGGAGVMTVLTIEIL